MMRQYLDMIDEAATSARHCEAWRQAIESAHAVRGKEIKDG